MRNLLKLGLLLSALVISKQVQAKLEAAAKQIPSADYFSPEFHSLWNSLVKDEIGFFAEHQLYRDILIDRCQRLSQQWKKELAIDLSDSSSALLIPEILIRDLESNPGPTGSDRHRKNSVVVTFRVGWFTTEGDQEMQTLWRSSARPLLISDKSGWRIETTDYQFLEQNARLTPSIRFLHILTHLMLRMDFLLSPSGSSWNPEEIQDRARNFEMAYQRWILRKLTKIYPAFALFLVSSDVDPANPIFALSQQYQNAWGAPDEIFVIVGKKFKLREQEHLLGETVLLKKAAQQRGHEANFISAWSCHTLALKPAEDRSPPRVIPLGTPAQMGAGLLQIPAHRKAFKACAEASETPIPLWNILSNWPMGID
ncbi:MAG: hypothetical protein LBF21_00030 [Puniceicoccales bacterium]|jgi:hypothetical protein|nr:hypothetical protein [Puniceicoccales bacterium]